MRFRGLLSIQIAAVPRCALLFVPRFALLSHHILRHNPSAGRQVLDDCRRSMNNDGIIDLEEARIIVLDVLDGPRRAVRGIVTAVSRCNLNPWNPR